MKKTFLILVSLAFSSALFASSQLNDATGTMTGDNGTQAWITGGNIGTTYVLTCTSVLTTSYGLSGTGGSSATSRLYSSNVTVNGSNGVITGYSVSSPFTYANQSYRRGADSSQGRSLPTNYVSVNTWYVNGVSVGVQVDNGTYYSNAWNVQTLVGWVPFNIPLTIRHPQPLTISIVSTSATGQTVALYDSSGAKVANWTLAANSTNNLTYTPSDSCMAGTYSLDVLNGSAGVLLGSSVLATGSSSSQYSFNWSNAINVTIVGSSGVAPPAASGANGLITNNSGVVQTLQFYGPDGSAVGLPLTIPAGGTLDPGAMAPVLASGVTQETLTLKNTTTGQTLGSETITAPSDGISARTVSGVISQTLEASTGSGTTTTTGTTITVTTGTGSTSGTSTATSTTKTTGQITPTDFYQAVKDAMQDEANISAGRSAAVNDAIFAALSASDGHITDVQNSLNSIVATGSSSVEKLATIGTSFNISELTSAMSSAGSVSALNFGTIATGLGSGSYTIGATLVPWMPAISLLRSALSFGLWFMFILAILRYFTKTD